MNLIQNSIGPLQNLIIKHSTQHGIQAQPKNFHNFD